MDIEFSTNEQGKQTRRYLLSIIIPTKNRTETASESVYLATEVGPATDVEVIVQDCSDNDSLECALDEQRILARVNYERTQPVSMIENWNRAISRATGEYILIVGDDDAVYPSALAVAGWALSNGLSAVKQKTYDKYWWPGFFDPNLESKFSYYKSHSGAFALEQTRPLLVKHSAVGDAYSTFPMAYHNLIHHSVFLELLRRTGRYFDSLSPDVYSGYAIACVLDSFAVLDFPFSVVGSSNKSNSQRSKTGLHKSHFLEFSNYQFSDMVPHTPNLSAANPDSMLKAFQNLDRFDLYQFVDFPRIFARTIYAEPISWRVHLNRFYETVGLLRKPKHLWSAMLLFNLVGKFFKAKLEVVQKRKADMDVSRDLILCDSLSKAVKFKMETISNVRIQSSRETAFGGTYIPFSQGGA